MRIIPISIMLALTPWAQSAPQEAPESLQGARAARLEKAVKENRLPGMAIALAARRDRTSWSGEASGSAPGQSTPLTAKTPVRIASNTKTYVAAAVLRQWEEGRIDIRDKISDLIDPRFDRMLRDDGFRTSSITVLHLLTHTSGLSDHMAGGLYAQQVVADPQRVWTPEDQLRGALEYADPLGAPGEVFTYSDTGYVLLGHILERLSGRNLGQVVRESLGFDRLGLKDTWWERFEAAPSTALDRAHQYLQGLDTYDFDPSMDLYGGGGLLSSVRDMARFYAGLFRGEVFKKDSTLRRMTSSDASPEGSTYRIGLSERRVAGLQVFEHTGFWGTRALYVPELDLALAGVVLDQEGFRHLVRLMNEIVREEAERR